MLSIVAPADFRSPPRAARTALLLELIEHVWFGASPRALPTFAPPCRRRPLDHRSIQSAAITRQYPQLAA
ncbi:hypothetical protein [Asaia astilbis]|uniref:hypothetical protein n=1 Tax=Asaia astilbis TaxID=610244 RepID=UPI000A704EC7|nr:hypothetical protein [Asaia astilbis]